MYSVYHFGTVPLSRIYELGKKKTFYRRCPGYLWNYFI